MDTDRNKTLIRSWLAMADAGFSGCFEDFFAPDYVGHLAHFPDHDLSELKRLERAFAFAFPDAVRTTHDLIAEGDKVVLRLTTNATHLGKFLHVEPTGRKVQFTGMVIYRIDGEKIRESWAEIDFGALMRQLSAS